MPRRAPQQLSSTPPRDAGPSLRDEAGFGLIEVLVSAVLVVGLMLATLGLLDSASATAGRNEDKTVGTALAQQDQERMRSMPFAALTALSESRTVTVGGVGYAVTSKSFYQTDTCTQSTCAQADYVRLQTTVRREGVTNVSPVTVEGLVHPSLGGGSAGCIVVSVVDSAGAPMPGVTVQIAGPSSFTGTTSTTGSATFAFLPVGEYTITFPGELVDASGSTLSKILGNIVGGGTSSYSTALDRPGTLAATFETRVAGGTMMAASAENLTLEHSGIPGGQSRVFTPNPGPSGTTIDALSLFPFTSPYSIYSGDCMGNRLPASLVSQLPAGRYQTEMRILPGSAHTARVFEPAIDLTVLSGNKAVSGALVKITSQGACAGTVSTQTTVTGGKLPEPGFPYGEYSICAEYRSSGTTRSLSTTTNVVNDQLDGRALTLAIPSSGTGTPCP